MMGRIASLNGTTFPALELQGRTCQRESGCVGHAAGSEGWLGHYLTWFVPGVGEFFPFTWGLQRKQGPCIWGIITFFFYSKANAPYFPGVGVSIDRCITLEFVLNTLLVVLSQMIQKPKDMFPRYLVTAIVFLILHEGVETV